MDEKYKVEESDILSSKDSHKIPFDYVTTDGEKDHSTVIMVHGQGCTRRNNMGVEQAFLDMGYNVLALDLPSSGENKAPYTTYGILEQYDILDCINYVDEQISASNKVYLFGCSYGGGVVSVSLGNEEINNKIAGAILDCPVASMKNLITRFLDSSVSETNVSTLLDGCNDLMNLLFGFTMADADGVTAISKTTVPVLIFTSKADTVVPMEDPKSLYDAISHDQKNLCVFETSGHTCGFTEDNEVYCKTLSSFFDGSLYQ